MAKIIDRFLADCASLFADSHRLLKLRFPDGAPVREGTLVPHVLAGEEGLSRCYRYQLDCLSPDAYFELKAAFGLPVEVALLLPDGGERLFTGLVTESASFGGDGGFARYRLTIEPALTTLGKRFNSRVFQDKSVIEIVQAILDEHLAGNPAIARSFRHEARVSQRYPKRSYCSQYRESDLAFIERLLAEEGISYRFTHGPDPKTSLREADAGGDAGTPLHTLILFDAGTTQASAGKVRFHRTDGVETEDAIDAWEGSRTLQSGRSALATYDYKNPGPYGDKEATWMDAGQSGKPLAAGLEDYDPQALYYGSDSREMERYTKLRQQAQDLLTKTFTGQGSARHLETGTWFALKDHPVHDQDHPEDREFLVTGLQFEARNNLLPDEAPVPGSLLADATGTGQNQPPYRNTFTAVRRHVPLVPEYTRTRHQKPTAQGSTTATVVGPAGEEIFTDELGRIKIQFHWQRKSDHPEGGADLDDRSSTWVRVAYPSAGANWGSQYIPRIGQEVVITFLEGDIDRPLVTGVVYNGTQRPPDFSGAGKLPANKTLSGVKTKEYKAWGYNELLFDDTKGEIRTKLSSEHGKTQLNLGYLIHPRTEGKGEPRGEGFELRTDDTGTLRGAKGLLLSAWQRLNARDRQLSREEAESLMETCLELFKQFGEYAAQHQALPLDPQPQAELKDAFKHWENGSNSTPNGNPAGGAPVIAMSAPAGISTTTPECIVTYAGKNLDTVAQQHMQLTAGQRYNLNAGKGISLFSHADGLKAIAHHGKLILQSQHDDTEINASENIKFTASHGRIVGFAQQEILLGVSGGAGIRIHGTEIDLICPGNLNVKAASHHWDGPGSVATDLPRFDGDNPDQKFVLRFDPRTALSQIAPNVPYEIGLTDGTNLKGISDAEGKTELLERDRMRIANIRILRNEE